MAKLVREEGILDAIKRTDGVEMRYHVFTRNGKRVVRRVPWHFDRIGNHGWYTSVEGPEMSLESLKELVNAS